MINSNLLLFEALEEELLPFKEDELLLLKLLDELLPLVWQEVSTKRINIDSEAN